MKIKNLKIMGSNYKIEEVEQIDKWQRLLGQIDYINQTIKIDKNIPEDLKMDTLIHEIIHGVLDKLGYVEINSDEQKVNGIANALFAVLKDNDLLKGV